MAKNYNVGGKVRQTDPIVCSNLFVVRIASSDIVLFVYFPISCVHSGNIIIASFVIIFI